MRDSSNHENFSFIVGIIVGIGFGLYVGVLLHACSTGSETCEKTVHYLEQKVASHAN